MQWHGYATAYLHWTWYSIYLCTALHTILVANNTNIYFSSLYWYFQCRSEWVGRWSCPGGCSGCISTGVPARTKAEFKGSREFVELNTNMHFYTSKHCKGTMYWLISWYLWLWRLFCICTKWVCSAIYSSLALCTLQLSIAFPLALISISVCRTCINDCQPILLVHCFPFGSTLCMHAAHNYCVAITTHTTMLARSKGRKPQIRICLLAERELNQQLMAYSVV